MGKLEDLKNKNKERLSNFGNESEMEEFDIFSDVDIFDEISKGLEEITKENEAEEKHESKDNSQVGALDSLFGMFENINDDKNEHTEMQKVSAVAEDEKTEEKVEQKTEEKVEQKTEEKAEEKVEPKVELKAEEKKEETKLDFPALDEIDEDVFNYPGDNTEDDDEEEGEVVEEIEIPLDSIKYDENGNAYFDVEDEEMKKLLNSSEVNFINEDEVEEKQEIEEDTTEEIPVTRTEFSESILYDYEQKVFAIDQVDFFENGNSIVTFAFNNEDVASYFDLGFENSDINFDFAKVSKFNTLGKEQFKNLYVVGLGEKKEFTQEQLFELATKLFEQIDEIVNVDLITVDFCEKKNFATILTEVYLNSKYEVNKISNKELPQKEVKDLFLASDVDIQPEIDHSTIVSNSQSLIKDLVYLPGNVLTPEVFVQFIKDTISDLNSVNIDVKDTEKLIEEKFGLMVSVNKGSSKNAYIVTLEYNGSKHESYYKTLIGKGITFDTGGYSMKSVTNMLEMHGDMAGAATAFSTLVAVARLQSQINLRCIIPISENMISDAAYKVEDVLVSKSGKTVQVLSTDAEGRLVLADALTHAQSFQTDEIITLATLTASNMLTDYEITPVFSNSNDLSYELITKSNEVSDYIWPMPLNHFNGVLSNKVESSSKIADVANKSSKAGSPFIYGANFIYNFVEDASKTHFAHFDIGGQSMVKGEVKTPVLKTLINYYKI